MGLSRTTSTGAKAGKLTSKSMISKKSIDLVLDIGLYVAQHVGVPHHSHRWAPYDDTDECCRNSCASPIPDEEQEAFELFDLWDTVKGGQSSRLRRALANCKGVPPRSQPWRSAPSLCMRTMHDAPSNERSAFSAKTSERSPMMSLR